MIFQTGEVIRSRRKNNPLIFHYGIIYHNNGNTYVMHNPGGEKPIIDTTNEFYKNRYFEKSFGKLTNKSDAELLQKFNTIKDKNFNTFTFNCEDFINNMIDEFRFQSGKIQLSIFIIIVIFIIILLLCKVYKKCSEN